MPISTVRPRSRSMRSSRFARACLVALDSGMRGMTAPELIRLALTKVGAKG